MRPTYKLLVILFNFLVLYCPTAVSQNSTWATKAPMPTPRYSLGVGVVNGALYAVGGTTSVTSSGTDISALEAYDPVSNTWSTKAPIPTARHSFGVGVVNGLLYAVGGYAFSCLCDVSTVEAYDPASDTWSAKAPMPTARDGLAVGVVNGVLYAAGGFANGTYLSTVEAYDPASNTWQALPPMLTPRYEPAAGVVDGVLYVVGGSYFGNLSTLEAYDPHSNTWSTKAPMPTARYYLGAGVVNEVLYAVGGHNGTSALMTVEAYDPASDSWTGVAPMPTARLPVAGVANGILYAVGGYDYNAGSALSTNEALTPTPTGVAVLNAGNVFTGNQTVNGDVNATNFVGNGAGLTGVITGVTAGAGLIGGGTGGNISLSFASASCGAGSAVTAHPFTCTAFPTFGANTFTGNQAMPSLTVSNITTNLISVTNGSNAIVASTTGSGLAAIVASSSAGPGVSASSPFGQAVLGTSSGGTGVSGNATTGTGVIGVSSSGAGVTGNTSSTSPTAAAGVFNNSGTTNTGNILLGQYQGTKQFAVDAKGDVTASGSVTIGGGSPILEHLSATPTIIVTPIAPSNCITISNVSVPGASDGDTLALGVKNAMVPGGSLNYFAWVSAPGIVTIRVCNIKGSTNTQITGTIRVDIWKH
jgi:hypothetical protein